MRCRWRNLLLLLFGLMWLAGCIEMGQLTTQRFNADGSSQLTFEMYMDYNQTTLDSYFTNTSSEYPVGLRVQIGRALVDSYIAAQLKSICDYMSGVDECRVGNDGHLIVKATLPSRSDWYSVLGPAPGSASPQTTYQIHRVPTLAYFFANDTTLRVYYSSFNSRYKTEIRSRLEPLSIPNKSAVILQSESLFDAMGNSADNSSASDNPATLAMWMSPMRNHEVLYLDFQNGMLGNQSFADLQRQLDTTNQNLSPDLRFRYVLSYSAAFPAPILSASAGSGRAAAFEGDHLTLSLADMARMGAGSLVVVTQGSLPPGGGPLLPPAPPPVPPAPGCHSDADCAGGEICDAASGLCARPASNCTSVINNGNSSDKLDLVFVGDGYADDAALRVEVLRMVDWNGTQNGLMSLEPFRADRSRFNIWMVRAPAAVAADGRGVPRRSDALALASQCTTAEYQITLSTKLFRSHAYTSSTDAYISMDPNEEPLGRVVSHEFGHLLGQLRDEYVETTNGNRSGRPNCAPNNATARSWWGGVAGTGYFAGCSYINENVRPTFNSVMREHWILNDDFGPVNRPALETALNRYR